jgi:aminopeptidase
MASYTPPDSIIDQYARVLIRFALNSGTGLKKGETVYLQAPEAAKKLYMACRREIIEAGGHVLGNYQPDEEKGTGSLHEFYTHAQPHQVRFFPTAYYKGLVNTIDHQVIIFADVDMQSLTGVDPKKILLRGEAMRPFMDWRSKKEIAGKFTWVLALYGTDAMATEAGMTLAEYWEQIINACFLDAEDPILQWKKVATELNSLKKRMNALTPSIERLHVMGPDIDLWITPGEKRAWMAGGGRNIPSFELFTSPDWRGTEGWIRFNQPLYRYGNLIEGIELRFAKGKVVWASATKNETVLKEMIATKNADKIGEFSLTDRRHSRITRFMAETLFDENMGGPEGNTHIALGSSFHECYAGDPKKVTTAGWKKLGYNDSSVHTDIVSTAPRTVVAHLKDGSEKIIYTNGEFTL